MKSPAAAASSARLVAVDVTLYRALFEKLFAPRASPRVASLLFAIAALALLYGLLELLYRRRWFLRA